MKTTKNKIVKGIKILSNGPLYCAAFISFGFDCCKLNKEKITSIADPQSEQNRNHDKTGKEKEDDNEEDNQDGDQDKDDSDIDIIQNKEETNQKKTPTSQGVENPAFKGSSSSSNDPIDENNNLVKSLNVEERHSEQNKKRKQTKDPNTSSNKFNNTRPVKEKNGTRISTPNQQQQKVDRKNQNTTLDDSKNNNKDDKRVNNLHHKGDNQPQKNTKNQESKSGDTIKRDTSQGDKPKSPLEQFHERMKTLKSMLEDEKLKKYVTKKMKAFEKQYNGTMKMLDESKEEHKQHIKAFLDLANQYIGTLESHK